MYTPMQIFEVTIEMLFSLFFILSLNLLPMLLVTEFYFGRLKSDKN